MNTLMRLTLSSAAVLAAATAAPAAAKNVTADIPQIAGVMKAAGHPVEIKEAGGEKYISSEAAGYKYALFPFGCDDTGKACKSVQFFIAFNPDKSPSAEAMNAYAREHRWGRIYLDKDGDPAMEFDVDLEKGGMSEELFLDNVAYWEAVVEGYSKFVFAKE